MTRRALTAFAAVCLAAACGGSSSSDPDPYRGTVDPTAFDTKFVPIGSSASSALKGLCSATGTPLPCYPAQKGFAHGKSISFYNLVNAGTPQRVTFTAGIRQVTLFPMAATSLSGSYTIPSCFAGPAFNPVTDAWVHDSQYPIFSALPLATTQLGVLVLPLQAIYSVNARAECNDLKSADSVTANNMGATFDATPVAVKMWPMIDPNANFAPINGQTPPINYGWYRGLMGSFIDGGDVPLDSSGNVVPMDGVILDKSASSTAFTTDANVVILPLAPGEAGYSPVVRLNHYVLKSGETKNDICPAGTTCKPNQVDMSKTTAPDFAIFIVAPPQ